MRTVLPILILLAATLGTNPAIAQPGVIALFTDPAAWECNIIDDAPGIVQVYVVHLLTAGALASNFGIADYRHNLTYVGWEAAHSVTIGSNPYSGVAVSYDAGCLPAPIPIGTITYVKSGTSPDCGEIRVVRDPATVSGLIEGVDCSFNTTFPAGGRVRVNGVPGAWGLDYCGCGFHVPVEATSWGKVKAMYR